MEATVANNTANIEGYDAQLYNHDLAPVPQERRTWTMWNYMALWVGMCVCIPSYMIASSMIGGGMSMGQAIFTVFIGNALVLLPMILNGHVGVKYGIPFPIYARLSFGVKGANIPAVLRAVVACGWFGIQCWIGGSCIYSVLKVLFPAIASMPAVMPAFMGVELVPFLCFLVFVGLNVFLVWKGIESIKNLETFVAPILILSGLGLLYWAYLGAHGFGGMLSQPGKFKTSAEFWAFFVPSLTAMVGFWATLSLNIPDFTRYGRSQKDQILGQAFGLPPTMTLIAFIGVAVTSATTVIYGQPIWDPIQVVSRFNVPWLVVLAMIAIAMATLAMNLAANVVAPANDFSNLAPDKIDFKKGGYLTAFIGVLIMPWKLIADPNGYIFTWLVGYSALLGPIAGILLVDYFLIRRNAITVEDLYRREGRYSYCNGTNPCAIIALILGVLPNVPGFLVQIKALPKDSIPAFWGDLYGFAWFVGLFVAGIVYYALMANRKESNDTQREISHV